MSYICYGWRLLGCSYSYSGFTCNERSSHGNRYMHAIVGHHGSIYGSIPSSIVRISVALHIALSKN
jgi:hypothetical protein